MSYSDLLEPASTHDRGVTFLGSGIPERRTWDQLHEDALGFAAGLRARDIARPALLGGSTRETVTAVLGCVLAGVPILMLPPPNPRRAGTDAEPARRLLRGLGVSHVLHEERYRDYAGAVAGTAVALEDCTAPGGTRVPVEPADTVLLQLTSGTTEHARAVRITDACLAAYCEVFVPTIGRDPERDRHVSWLPLHYDLGMVTALLVAAASTTELVLAPPERFVESPRRWMSWLAEHGATETMAPSFAYAIAGRMPDPSLDLSSCRLVISGGEPVVAATTRAFVDAWAPAGLDPGTMTPGYGLAEATSAVTVRAPGGGLRVDVVDRDGLERDARAAAPAGPGSDVREIVSTGPPLPGVAVRIVEPVSGDVRDDREVGEIEVAGPTVTPGYEGVPVGPDMFRDGWLRTGDLGYLAGGELFPCGRLKDLIIAAGRNIAPEEIEFAAGAVAGTRTGNVIAFSIAGSAREEIVVVAEAREGADGVRDAIASAVRDAVGVSPYDVVLIAAGTLPKTASGKLQRAACRARYETGELTAEGARS